MFKIEISDISDHEINIAGDKHLVEQLYRIIHKSAWVHDYQNDNFVNRQNGNERAKFNIGLWNLKKSIDECSIAQILLNFIKTNNSAVDARTEYLLHYWAFEVEMIKNGNSYRSQLPSTSQSLTSPHKLNSILDRCQYSPSWEALFNLFEKSDAMEGNTAYCEPLMPYEYEIAAFERAKDKDHAQIRTASRIIAQGQRDQNCLFFKVPTDIGIMIASLTGDPLIHDEESARQIARTNFSKP